MTTTKTKSVAPARPGRPRDGSIRRKVIDAALECYEERGWSGFSFDAVSAKALVGKPAIYRRWSSREELLIDAFRELNPTLPVPDHGNIRDDLNDLAVAYRQGMAGTRGRAGTRLWIEQEAACEVFQAVSAEISFHQNRLILDTLRRGQLRGDVRSDADLDIATQLLLGALMHDTLNAKPSHDVRGTAAKMVEILLNGLSAQPSTGGG